jgi:hypothetical protein
VSRRAVLRAAAGVLAAGALPASHVPVGAQTPAAAPTPTPSPERVDAFVALSQALVGGGRLDPERAAQFLQLNDADPDRAAALDALLALDPATAVAEGVQASPVKPILHFWYRGVFDGQPVPDRETFWYGLSSWQSVRYTSSTSICKRFGDWAEAPVVR